MASNSKARNRAKAQNRSRMNSGSSTHLVEVIESESVETDKSKNEKPVETVAERFERSKMGKVRGKFARKQRSDHDRAVDAAVRSGFNTRTRQAFWIGIAAVVDYAIMMLTAIVIIPFTGIYVAKLTGITTASPGINIVGLWIMPLLSLVVIIIYVEFWCVRRVWRWGIRRAKYSAGIIDEAEMNVPAKASKRKAS